LADEDADPMDTWSVKDGVVHCKGQPAGYMRTTEKYSDYRLSFHWRWAGEEGGNSGCLLHIQKPDKVWPKSIESQLMAGNAGDIFVIGGTTFKEHTDKDSRRVPKMAESNEKPAGEWNQMTVACQGDAITIQVNGQLQNKATEATVTEGFIGLQSEGVPIEFKNITLTPLE
jgi:hypothetical protein